MTMIHTGNYLECETEFLRDNANKMSVREMARKLGRTEGAIRAKAHVMGVRFLKEGMTHHRAKLSDDDVRAARLARKEGTPTYVIARRYGVTNEYASQIVTGKARTSVH